MKIISSFSKIIHINYMISCYTCSQNAIVFILFSLPIPIKHYLCLSRIVLEVVSTPPWSTYVLLEYNCLPRRALENKKISKYNIIQGSNLNA